MNERQNSRVRRAACRALRASALAAALIVATPRVTAQTFVPRTDPRPLGDERLDGRGERRTASALARVHAELEALAGEEFRATAELRRDQDPITARDALLLRAGTPVPPGMSAALAARRRTARAEALDWIAAELAEGGAQAGQWSERLGQALAPRASRAEVAGTSAEDLWCAAAGAGAELGRVELAPRIAVGLAEGAGTRARHAARVALFRLFRRWFDTAGAFDLFWVRAGELRREQLFLDDLAAQQQLARAHFERLVELDPREAAAGLADPDPDLRAFAAGALAAGVAEDRVPPQSAIELLSTQLEHETDPQAFHTALDALLGLLGGAPPDSPGVTRLREILAAVPDTRPHFAPALIGALARLPWELEAADGPASLSQGIATSARLFDGMIDPERPLDSDVVVASVEALRSLCARAPDVAGQLESMAPARDGLRFLLVGYGGSREVRLAAASAASFVASAQDVEVLVRALAGETSFPALSYELLGSLGRLCARLDPDSAPARRAFETLVDHADSHDPELRRRALDVLGGAPLTVMVERLGEEHLLEPLVHDLAREEQPELQARLLSLVGRFARPSLVDTILAAENFDRLAGGDSKRVFELKETLLRLSGGDPERTLAGARRLLRASTDPGGSQPAGAEDAALRLARLQAAIDLACALSREHADALAPEQHLAIIDWALELRRGTGSPAGGSEAMRAFLPRLVATHLPALSGLDADPRTLAHPTALLMGDLLVTHAAGEDPRPVLRQYLEALSFAREAGAGAGADERAAQGPFPRPAADVVLRDRARFYVALGRDRDALTDYRALLGSVAGSVAGSDAGVDGELALDVGSVLDLSDLRRAATLIGESGPGSNSDRRAAALEAFHLTRAFVQSPAWRLEPPSVRLQDLRDLTLRSVRARDAEAIELSHALLEGIPDEPLPADAPPTDPAPLWSGLERKPEWHATLLSIRGALPPRELAPITELEVETPQEDP